MVLIHQIAKSVSLSVAAPLALLASLVASLTTTVAAVLSKSTAASQDGPNPGAARSGPGRPCHCLDERLSSSVLSHFQFACGLTPSLSAVACPESTQNSPCKAPLLTTQVP